MANLDPRAKERLLWVAATMTIMVAEVFRHAARHPGSAYIETEEMRQAGAKKGLESLFKRKLTNKESEDLSTVMDVMAIKERGFAGVFDLDRRSRAQR